jgi:hypothetical protein
LQISAVNVSGKRSTKAGGQLLDNRAGIRFLRKTEDGLISK